MAGIHAEEVNRLKAGLFRSYQRQIYGWKMSIGENAAFLPPDWNKTALSFLLTHLICRLTGHLNFADYCAPLTLQISVPRGRSFFLTEASRRRMRPPLPGEGHSRPQSLTLVTLPSGLRSSSWSPGRSRSPCSEPTSACGTTGQGTMPRPVISRMSVTIMSSRSVEFMDENQSVFIITRVTQILRSRQIGQIPHHYSWCSS